MKLKILSEDNDGVPKAFVSYGYRYEIEDHRESGNWIVFLATCQNANDFKGLHITRIGAFGHEVGIGDRMVLVTSRWHMGMGGLGGRELGGGNHLAANAARGEWERVRNFIANAPLKEWWDRLCLSDYPAQIESVEL
jgi:hypothetical protein